MTDAVTSNYSLTQPLVGGDNGTWGTVLNNGTISPIDNILGSNLTASITSLDVTLTTAQFQNAVFVMSGTMTGDHALIVPLSPNSSTVACGGKFIVVNNTNGTANLSVKTAASGSTGVVVPNGGAASLYSDGTNVSYAANGLPAYAKAVNGDPNGQLAGTAGSNNTNVPIAVDYTTNNLYLCTTSGTAGSAVWTQPVSAITRGFDAPINLGLSVTHTGGNLLNVAVKTATGADPTTLSPVTTAFQTVSSSNTTGVPTTVNITGALSMNTNATGATLGTLSNTPFKIWFALFNNAGTAVLAMMNVLTSTQVFPVAEYGVASTTAISGTATSAGVWYTPNGTTLNNCAYRLIGYCEYAAGNTLATAGTYSANPSNVVLFGPGVKKPGDVVQIVSAIATTATSVTNSTKTQTNTQASVTPTLSSNPIIARATGAASNGAGGSTVLAIQLGRSTATLFGSAVPVGQNQILVPATVEAFDSSPSTTSQITYSIYIWNASGSGTSQWIGNQGGLASQSNLILQEIMG